LDNIQFVQVRERSYNNSSLSKGHKSSSLFLKQSKESMEQTKSDQDLSEAGKAADYGHKDGKEEQTNMQYTRNN